MDSIGYIVSLGYLGLSLLYPFFWAFRGGSLGNTETPRWLNLLVTPIAFLVQAICVLIGTGEVTLFSLYLLALAAALFVFAETPGWGRQFDLGRDDKPDDELFHKLRDIIWGDEKSSFGRDLTGLAMRFALFLLPVIPLSLSSIPMMVIPFVLLAFVGYGGYVLEHFLIYQKGKTPTKPYAEYFSGAVFGLGTLLVPIL